MSKPDAMVAGHTVGGTGWHRALGLILCLALGARVIDDLTGASAIAALVRIPGHEWASYATALVQILSLLAAGVAVDRYGVPRAVALSLAAWAALTALLAALAGLTPLLYLDHAAAVAVGCVFGVAIPAVAKLCYPLSRRAFALAVLNAVAIVWLVMLPWVLSDASWPPKPPSQPAWAIGCLIAAGLVLMLATVWSLTFGRRTGRASRAVGLDNPPEEGASFAAALALYRQPGLWALVVVSTCHMQVFAMLHRLTIPYMLTERFVTGEAFITAVAPPLAGSILAQLVFAVWSDRRARTTGRAAAARAPFIVTGALLSATVGLFPLVDRAFFGAIYWAVALGMGAFSLAFTLGYDIVPRAYAGRLMGTASAFSVLVNAVLFLVCGFISARTHSFACYLYVAGITALVGAVVAFARLRTVEPVEPTSALAIGEVFA